MSKKDNNIYHLSFSAIFLIVASFVEGASVMITELLGSKIVAPYYGASLFVWSSVLSVTLIGLAVGYFLGGYLVEKGRNYTQILLIQFLVSALFITLMPLISKSIMNSFSDMGVRWGSFFSLVVFFMTPIVIFGSITPIIIRLLTDYYKEKQQGAITGYLFAISTIGGVVFTLMAGFYLIPELGIKKLSYLTSIVLLLVVVLGAISVKKYVFVGISLVLVIFNVFLMNTKSKLTTGKVKVLYQEESMLGQLLVADFLDEEPSIRRLFVNNIAQSNCSHNNLPYSMWNYPHVITAVSSLKPVGSNALLVGMGAGSLVFELDNLLQFNLDVVEIDSRMLEVAKKYFNYNPKNTRIFFDDARRFINTSKAEKKYDVVVFDIVSGESQPNHVFSIEGFLALKKIIADDGIVILNYQSKAKSESVASIFNTLEKVGFKTSFYEANDGGSDFLIYARQNSPISSDELLSLRYNNFLPEQFKYSVDKLITTGKEFLYKDALVLTDDFPVLENMNSQYVLEWRTNYINSHTKGWLDVDLQFFK